MGWFLGDGSGPGHEGHVVGVVKDTSGKYPRWRELDADRDPKQTVQHVQVACDCGWRSPRMIGPSTAEFWPNSGVDLGSEDADRRAARIWKAHAVSVAGRRVATGLWNDELKPLEQRAWGFDTGVVE